MASSNQGGSILSFLIIGGVLTAVLVGGAYVVQQRATNTVATPVVTQPADTPDKAPAPAADDKKVAVEQNKDAAKKEEAAKQEAAKQEAAKREEAKKAEAQKQEAAKKEAAKPAAPAQTTPPATTELPKTGPAESVSTILGMGLLSYMIVSYVRSRSRSATL